MTLTRPKVRARVPVAPARTCAIAYERPELPGIERVDGRYRVPLVPERGCRTRVRVGLRCLPPLLASWDMGLSDYADGDAVTVLHDQVRGNDLERTDGSSATATCVVEEGRKFLRTTSVGVFAYPVFVKDSPTALAAQDLDAVACAMVLRDPYGAGFYGGVDVQLTKDGWTEGLAFAPSLNDSSEWLSYAQSSRYASGGSLFFQPGRPIPTTAWALVLLVLGRTREACAMRVNGSSIPLDFSGDEFLEALFPASPDVLRFRAHSSSPDIAEICLYAGAVGPGLLKIEQQLAAKHGISI